MGMVITYYGAESFKVQFGETVLGFNPISKEALKSGEKSIRFGADIAFVSAAVPVLNGVENLVSKGKAPFVISGPGEYEIKEVFIKGYPSKTFLSAEGEPAKEPRINTIYSAKLEGVHLVFLGALGGAELDDSIRGDLGEIDVLFVPIGGEGVLRAREAYKMAVNLNAKLVVPMHYERVAAEENCLEIFLKEGGREKPEKKNKLTFKPKDLVGQENEIVVLESDRSGG